MLELRRFRYRKAVQESPAQQPHRLVQLAGDQRSLALQAIKNHIGAANQQVSFEPQRRIAGQSRAQSVERLP